MKPLYIIPARSGSKGIPGKNIKLLGGRPLIAYAIENARAAGAPLSHILLSTDSDKIASVARSLGLPTPYMRPAALATDTAPTRDALLDAMDWADSNGVEYDCVVLLQPTSPLRQPEDILGALNLWTPDIDMVVSVVPAEANPYYNLFEASPDGFLHVSKGDGSITRRQDAPKVWEYNGAVYVITPASLRRRLMSQFKRIIPYEMPRERSIDLDTPADWAAAERMMKSDC